MQGPVGDPGLKGANGDAGAAVCHLLHLIMLFTYAHYFSAEEGGRDHVITTTN